MLKISLIDSPRQRRLVVEGKLIAPLGSELRNACQEESADLRERELVIEMKHVTTIGQEAQVRVDATLSRLSWKWRKRSSVKITERTYEKRAQALHC
jgi:hypothetical protein